MAELKEFKLPDVGEGLTEADIVTWHVKPGDQVEDGQIIVEIETAKAVVELPCPLEGTVARLLAEEGQTVEVGVPIIAVQVGSGPQTDDHRTSRRPRPAPRREPRDMRRPSGCRSWSATASRPRAAPRAVRASGPDPRRRGTRATRPETAEIPGGARGRPGRTAGTAGRSAPARRAGAGQAAGAQAGQGSRHRPGPAGRQRQRPGRLYYPRRRAAGGDHGKRRPVRPSRKTGDGRPPRLRRPARAARSASRSGGCASTWPRPWCRAPSPRRTSPSSCRST